ncbi:MAG: winged helix-turn-helix transcriptional regulator [Acidimicrobiales bacterium]
MRSYGQYCAVAKALDVVGDRWTLLVLRELLLRAPCRYTDLRHGLPGIATNLLTDRLRDLELHGLVRRDEAPPPVATTLYDLTDAGRDIEPVIRALGHFGTRYMSEPSGDEIFRSHWMTFPVSEYLHDSRPEDGPVEIEIRIGDELSVVEVGGGEVRARLGSSAAPVLVLEGEAPVVIGLLTRHLDLRRARSMGLVIQGDSSVLGRIESDTAQRRIGSN